MGLIESLKVSAIRTADALNRLNDPFPPFDRPALPRDEKTLKQREEEFFRDLIENFWVCDGQVLAHRLPQPAGSPIDLGDQAIWHGVYTATLALRYYVNSHSYDTSRYPAADETYGHLVAAAKGLQLHQTIHHEAKPRLVRGVSDDLATWQDDASNDSASGHLLGIYFGWKYGPEPMRPVFAQLAGGLAAEILNHGHALVRADGSPTTYGALEQGWQTDPLRVSLALAIYAVAASLTGVAEFAKAYSDLYSRYGRLACYPKAKLWWVENQNDTHRAAIHLAILAELTRGEPHRDYCEGLRRIRLMVNKLGNVWVNALYAWGVDVPASNDRELALKVLSEFNLQAKQFNVGRDNYLGWKQGKISDPAFKPILWNGTWMANQPLPRWLARSQDFFWQRNLRSLDIGTQGNEADSRLNGGDFLAAYWLSRQVGTLTDRD